MKFHTLATLIDDSTFDEIIDVRTPAEYLLDHIPGAVNYPVLSNEERIIVGTKYKQESSFEAKKLGATLIARNIANHIEAEFAKRPKNWRPLIYCWRGGKRSSAMGHILRQIGWDAHVLDGGYKTYRTHVIQSLNELPKQFQFLVISGRTGSAKSRVLEELTRMGCQVLHLEELANHKGSVLGASLDSEQPSQKYLETLINVSLKQFDPNQVVLIEAESKKVGGLQVPDTLIEAIRSSPCIRLEASMDARVSFLEEDYRCLIEQPSFLLEKLQHLKALVGQEQLNLWFELIAQQDWRALIRSLLELHYDRLYDRSQLRNFENYEKAPLIQIDDLSKAGIQQIASQIQHMVNQSK